MKKTLAVLATAALALVGNITQAADSYSPDSSATIKRAVTVDSSTGVQTYPASYKLLQGYDSTNTSTLTTTGTNFVVAPIARYQLITAAGAVNLLPASNTSATTGWETTIAIKAGTADRALSYPSSWNWTTNAALPAKLTTVSSNTFGVLRITAIGTNIFVGAGLAK